MRWECLGQSERALRMASEQRPEGSEGTNDGEI